MRKSKSELEVFNVSLIDLISGALGIMSILFFTIIPLISKSTVITSVNQISPINDIVSTHITVSILHSTLSELRISGLDNATKLLESEYFIDEDTALYKSTFLIEQDKDIAEFTINTNMDDIFPGSFVSVHGIIQQRLIVDTPRKNIKVKLN